MGDIINIDFTINTLKKDIMVKSFDGKEFVAMAGSKFKNLRILKDGNYQFDYKEDPFFGLDYNEIFYQDVENRTRWEVVFSETKPI